MPEHMDELTRIQPGPQHPQRSNRERPEQAPQSARVVPSLCVTTT